MNGIGENDGAPVTEAHYNPAEIGALAHLYRGEMYQTKIWRAGSTRPPTGRW